jgi:hypothetical protein
MRIWPTKRVWKRWGIGLAILFALALIVNGVFAWRADWQLRSRLAAIRVAGDPASIAELAPQPVPDEENAAAILRKMEPRLEAFGSEQGRFFDTAVGQAYDEARDRGEPPTVEQIAAIRAILENYPDVDAAIVKAAACERYASQLDFSLNQRKFVEAIIAHQSVVRTAARYKSWKMEVELANGQTEAAIEHGLQILRLGRLYDNEPSLVCFLIGTAVRQIAAQALYDALSMGTIAARTHGTLDAELARQDDPDRLRRAIVTERALATGWYDAVTERLEFFRFASKALGWPLKNYQTGSLALMSKQLELAGKPWHEVRKQFGKGDSPIPPSGHGVMADLLMPALSAAFEANARNIAQLRSLRIYNSLRQFAEEHGREATGLDELKLPADATIDPYSGEPLKLKHTDDGWIIYSVMRNGVDDGGDFIELKDFGVAPARYRMTEKPEETAEEDGEPTQ